MTQCKITQAVIKQYGGTSRQWEFILGVETGVGIEYFLRNKKTGQEVYYCDDQGCVSIDSQ